MPTQRPNPSRMASVASSPACARGGDVFPGDLTGVAAGQRHRGGQPSRLRRHPTEVGEGRAGGEALPAPPAAARAVRALGVDDHVTHLADEAVGPALDDAAGQHTTADPGAQGDEHGVPRALGVADGGLGQQCAGGVVVDGRVVAEPFGQQVPQRQVRHLGDVRRGAEHALPGDQAGHTDAERVGRPERPAELAETGDQLVGLLRRRPPLLGEDRAVVAEQHAQALRSPDVDPDAPRHDTSMCSTSPERGGCLPLGPALGPGTARRNPSSSAVETADHLGQAFGGGRVVERPFDGVEELATDVDRGPHDGLHRLDRLVGRRRRGLAGRRRRGHGRIPGRRGLTCHPVDASDRRRSR